MTCVMKAGRVAYLCPHNTSMVQVHVFEVCNDSERIDGRGPGASSQYISQRAVHTVLRQVCT